MSPDASTAEQLSFWDWHLGRVLTEEVVFENAAKG